MSIDTNVKQPLRYWPILSDGYLHQEIYPLFPDDQRELVMAWVTGRMNGWAQEPDDVYVAGRPAIITDMTVHRIIRNMDIEAAQQLNEWSEMAVMVLNEGLCARIVVEAHEPGTVANILDLFTDLMQWAHNRFIIARL